MDRRERILNAVKTAGVGVADRIWGLARVNGHWINLFDRACPLGCLVLTEQPGHTNYFDGIRHILGVTDQWVDGFIWGFDGLTFNPSIHEIEGYTLGKEFRECLLLSSAT